MAYVGSGVIQFGGAALIKPWIGSGVITFGGEYQYFPGLTPISGRGNFYLGGTSLGKVKLSANYVESAGITSTLTGDVAAGTYIGPQTLSFFWGGPYPNSYNRSDGAYSITYQWNQWWVTQNNNAFGITDSTKGLRGPYNDGAVFNAASPIVFSGSAKVKIGANYSGSGGIVFGSSTIAKSNQKFVSAIHSNFVLTLTYDAGYSTGYAGTWIYSGFFNGFPYWVNGPLYCYWNGVSSWYLNNSLGGLWINKPSSTNGINFSDFYGDTWTASPSLFSYGITFAGACSDSQTGNGKYIGSGSIQLGGKSSLPSVGLSFVSSGTTIALSGTAKKVQGFPYAGSNGITFGSTTAVTSNQKAIGSGILAFTGVAGLGQGRNGAGSILFSGLSSRQLMDNVVGSALFTIGGKSVVSTIVGYSGSATMLLGGTATIKNGAKYVGSNGIAFGGVSTSSNTSTIKGSGRLVFSGTANLKNWYKAGSGTIAFGGHGEGAGTDILIQTIENVTVTALYSAEGLVSPLYAGEVTVTDWYEGEVMILVDMEQTVSMEAFSSAFNAGFN
jgi:hypothetical protein